MISAYPTLAARGARPALAISVRRFALIYCVALATPRLLVPETPLNALTALVYPVLVILLSTLIIKIASVYSVECDRAIKRMFRAASRGLRYGQVVALNLLDPFNAIAEQRLTYHRVDNPVEVEFTGLPLSLNVDKVPSPWWRLNFHNHSNEVQYVKQIQFTNRKGGLETVHIWTPQLKNPDYENLHFAIAPKAMVEIAPLIRHFPGVYAVVTFENGRQVVTNTAAGSGEPLPSKQAQLLS